MKKELVPIFVKVCIKMGGGMVNCYIPFKKGISKYMLWTFKMFLSFASINPLLEIYPKEIISTVYKSLHIGYLLQHYV